MNQLENPNLPLDQNKFAFAEFIKWNGKEYRIVGWDSHSSNPFQKKWDYILQDCKTNEEIRVFLKDICEAEIITKLQNVLQR